MAKERIEDDLRRWLPNEGPRNTARVVNKVRSTLDGRRFVGKTIVRIAAWLCVAMIGGSIAIGFIAR